MDIVAVLITLACGFLAPMEHGPYLSGGYESLSCSATGHGMCCRVVYQLHTPAVRGVETWCYTGACVWHLEGSGWI